MTRAEVVKALQTSDVEMFSGEGNNKDAEEFLQSLDKAVIDGQLADVEILCAVSTILHGGARHWWRTNRDFIGTWSEFKFYFKRMYVKEFDEEDLWTDLRRRAQAEREPIIPFING